MTWRAIAATAALWAGLAGAACAQAWPGAQTIRIIVPFSAGSAVDLMARLVADHVAKQIGQSIIVENRLGAGGTIGMAEVAKAKPDGYTVLINSSVHTITPSTYAHLPYDTARDFSAIIPLAQLPQVLVVSPAKYATVHDLVAAGKAKPDALAYGSGGVGGTSHLNAERFALSAGFTAVHIPFPGAPEALREVMGQRIDFYFSPILAAVPLVKDGSLKALAVSTRNRSRALPAVPTTLELGYKDSDYTFWAGVFVPSGTPRPIVQHLHDQIAAALAAPDVRERLTGLGAEPMPMQPEEFDRYVRDEIEALGAVVKRAGIKPN